MAYEFIDLLTIPTVEDAVSFETSASSELGLPSPFEMAACPRCGERVLAPIAASYVVNNGIRHQWSCDDCGHEFETSVNWPILRVLL